MNRKLFSYISLNGELLQSTTEKVINLITMLENEPGVYTTLKVKQGIPLFLEDHLERLTNNADVLNIPRPDEKKLRAALSQLLAKNQETECGIRITLLSNLDMLITAFALPPTGQKINVISIPDTRDEIKFIKANQKPLHDKAMQIAHEQNAEDAIFTDEAGLIESTYAALIGMDRNGDLITPIIEGRGLPSITVMHLSEQTDIKPQPMKENSEGPLVLVNSLRSRKVSAIADNHLRDAGKLLLRIEKLREQAEDRYIQSAR